MRFSLCLGVNFINVFVLIFRTNVLFSSYVSALSKNLYKKFTHLMLMKLKLSCCIRVSLPSPKIILTYKMTLRKLISKCEQILALVYYSEIYFGDFCQSHLASSAKSTELWLGTRKGGPDRVRVGDAKLVRKGHTRLVIFLLICKLNQKVSISAIIYKVFHRNR
jgi:hypothetical protein